MLTVATRGSIAERAAAPKCTDARAHSGVHHWFASGDDWCAASWHAAPSPRARVAVLCPSIAQEHLRGSRDFRVLAARLAHAGVSTLRFDYPATGNSTGDAIASDGASTDLGSRWCAAIRDAVAHARRLAPDAQVVLIGRRMGALLAARASSGIDGGVAACVMWEAALTGSGHLRELRLREGARLDVLFAKELDRREPGVAFQTEGHRFDALTIESLTQLSLDGLCPRASAVHLVGTLPDRLMRAVAGWSEVGGIRVESHRTADAAFDWARAEGPRLPEETFAAIGRIAVADVPISRGAGAERPPVTEPDRIVLRREGDSAIGERLLRFGERDAYFGALSTPERDTRIATAVLILGTGIEPSPGFGDSWTRFARKAAGQRAAVLRMDYRGNGESVVRDGGRENVSYQPGRADDVRAGVEWLRTQWPSARVVVAGICTGGYHGIHAAAQGVPIDDVIAINPQLWCTDESTMDQAPSEDLILARRSTQAAHDVGKWLRLVRGGYRLRDVRHAVRGLLGQIAVTALGRRSGGTLGGGMPRLDFKRLFPRHTSFQIIFSQDDPGYEHLLAHGRRPVRWLSNAPHIELRTMPGVDHTFSREWMRRQLDDALLEAIRKISA